MLDYFFSVTNEGTYCKHGRQLSICGPYRKDASKTKVPRYLHPVNCSLEGMLEFYSPMRHYFSRCLTVSQRRVGEVEVGVKDT